MQSANKILVIEDDKDICQLIKLSLEYEEFIIDIVYDGVEAVNKISQNYYSVIILDVMLPKMDGWEVCQRIRNNNKNQHVPLIMLTAKVGEDDRIQGLNLGADDYITKPFSPRELVARVKALLRREREFKNDRGSLTIGDMVISPESYKVFVKNQQIELSPKEFELLYLLANNQDIVFTREEMLDKIWGFSFLGSTRTVDEHIKRLRKKVEGVSDYLYFHTIHGVGYKFEVLEKC